MRFWKQKPVQINFPIYISAKQLANFQPWCLAQGRHFITCSFSRRSHKPLSFWCVSKVITANNFFSPKHLNQLAGDWLATIHKLVMYEVKFLWFVVTFFALHQCASATKPPNQYPPKHRLATILAEIAIHNRVLAVLWCVYRLYRKWKCRSRTLQNKDLAVFPPHMRTRLNQ